VSAARTCPVCRKAVPPIDWDAPFRPFCSARCKKIDLGSWLDGQYRISRPLSEEELDQGLPGGTGSGASNDPS
jgi:endogenous inhibitor of DNA gyrase (YacG/DUF329 family)